MNHILPTPDAEVALRQLLSQISYSALFLLTDSNVAQHVLPRFKSFLEDYNPHIIVIEAGEENKSVESLCRIWRELSEHGGTRDALLINLGGGVITDIGGFAAATFKRGIRFINVPTTVLGAADASVGGKTGIDFGGLKNEVGAFAEAEAVVIDTNLFSTLSDAELLSGYAEVVKMAMIRDGRMYNRVLSSSPLEDAELLQEALSFAVEEKDKITTEDPREKGLRKILNFGHTCGHAFETLMLERGEPIAHGCAVAHGMAVALILSHLLLKLPSAEIERYISGILHPYYKRLPITCKDYPRLIELMGKDKKNRKAGEIRFVLLSAIGEPAIDVQVGIPDLETALDIYQTEA